MIAKKLHLKPGMQVSLVHSPAGFSLGSPPGVMVRKSLTRQLDLVLVFATTQKALNALWPRLLASVKRDGAIWVAYPKKSSGLDSDLAGMQPLDASGRSDWNPVSRIALDDTWAAVRYKYAPGLDHERRERRSRTIADTDGTVVVHREHRTVTPPKDLERRLARNAMARSAFNALSFSHRKEYVVWIVEAKKAETREARVIKTVRMLAAGRRNPSDRG